MKKIVIIHFRVPHKQKKKIKYKKKNILEENKKNINQGTKYTRTPRK